MDLPVCLESYDVNERNWLHNFGNSSNMMCNQTTFISCLSRFPVTDESGLTVKDPKLLLK